MIQNRSPSSLRSQHIRRTDKSTPGKDQQVRLKCYDPSDVRSLILTLDDSSVPRLINPRNHRFFAGAAGCSGRLPQAEATSGEANNQKDLIETGSLSVWNTFDGSLKQVFSANFYFLQVVLWGEGIIPDSFAKGFNALRPLNYGAGGMAASDVTWC